MPRPACSALLLAGGQSRRMGTDKAGLLLEGRPLWEHQWATLQGLDPAEAFVSGPPGCCPGVEILSDEKPGLGPLAGLAAGLRRARHPWLVVLAIDLPLLPAAFLAELLGRADRAGKGMVPMRARGPEPLAAVYPREALLHAEAALAAGRLSLHALVEALQAASLVAIVPVATEEEPFFTNANTPAEWAALIAARGVSRSARPPSSGR